MGTPDFAVPTLAALFDSGYEIAAVYTQPPRAAGRGMSLRKSAVQVFAEAANMEVRVPERLKFAEEQERFRTLEVRREIVLLVVAPAEHRDTRPKRATARELGGRALRWRD